MTYEYGGNFRSEGNLITRILPSGRVPYGRRERTRYTTKRAHAHHIAANLSLYPLRQDRDQVTCTFCMSPGDMRPKSKFKYCEKI
jgi:hypothetical protein